MKTSVINSLSRALQVMEILAHSDREIGVTDLAQKLGIDKSRAYRIVCTLVNERYAEQNPETKKYRLGLKIVELASTVLENMELVNVAKPFMKQLVQETNQTAHLAALDQGCPVCIDQEETPSMVKVNMATGRETPGHCSAVGKIIWAYLEEDKLDGILQEKVLTRFTARTIVTVPELKMHLKKVREQGYAVDDEEFSIGIRCIAVPVWNGQGRVVAAMGISGLAVNLSLEKLDELIEKTMRGRDSLSAKLGYTG